MRAYLLPPIARQINAVSLGRRGADNGFLVDWRPVSLSSAYLILLPMRNDERELQPTPIIRHSR